MLLMCDRKRPSSLSPWLHMMKVLSTYRSQHFALSGADVITIASNISIYSPIVANFYWSFAGPMAVWVRRFTISWCTQTDVPTNCQIITPGRSERCWALVPWCWIGPQSKLYKTQEKIYALDSNRGVLTLWVPWRLYINHPLWLAVFF